MGVFCCSHKSKSVDFKTDQMLSKILQEQQPHAANTLTILLLGPGECGKSTVMKQMRLSSKKSFSIEEAKGYKQDILQNVVDSMKQTLQAAYKMGIELKTPRSKHFAQLISRCTLNLQERDSEFVLPLDIAEAIRFLWIDVGFKEGFDLLRRESYILDSAPYFFENVDRYSQPGYLPSTTDILKARIKTTGITTETFQRKGFSIVMIDVGGQRSERKKWYANFEGVSAIIFCASLADYDQFLNEESTESRLVESIQLFRYIINNQYFMQSSVILLLNKLDIFEQKLKVSPLENYFPEYKGGSSLEAAKDFMLQYYMSLNTNGRKIAHLFSTATDPAVMDVVFDVMTETVLEKIMDFV